MPTTLACEVVVQSNYGPKVRFLPAPLIRARAEALNPRNCLDLNKTARQALYGILAFFDIRRPSEPVFASRENVCAESLLGSQPTLYRALATLVSKGYIRREQARRYGKETFGQYSISRIWLEEKALNFLGLKNKINDPDLSTRNTKSTQNQHPKKSEISVYPQGPSITLRDRIQDYELTPNQQLYSKEQPQKETPGLNEKGRAGESLKNGIDSKTGLPDELVKLMTLGLSKSRICGLMKQARQCGNGGKLGVITTLIWTRLQKLEGSHAVFAYLSKLVRQKKDFDRMLETQAQVEDKGKLSKLAIERLKSKMPVFLDRAKDMQLVTRKGNVIGHVRVTSSGGHIESIDEMGTRRVLPISVTIVEKWEEGDYVLRHTQTSPDLYGNNHDDWS